MLWVVEFFFIYNGYWHTTFNRLFFHFKNVLNGYFYIFFFWIWYGMVSFLSTLKACVLNNASRYCTSWCQLCFPLWVKMYLEVVQWLWWLRSNLSLKIVKGCFILFWFTPQGKWPGPPVTKISNNYCKRKVHKFEVFTWTWGWVLTWGKLVTVGPDCSGYCMPLRPSRCFLVTNIWIELILYVNVTDLF